MKRVALGGSRLAIAAVACAALASACASTSGDNAGQQTAERGRYEFGLVGGQSDAGAPVRGGTLTFADYAEARSLNPTLTYATGASGGDALAAVYDVLMRYDSESGKHEPWLAKSLESDAAFTTWTLKLRDGVTFSDGTSLDAGAVVASINYYMKNRGSDTALLAPNLKKMEATDASTVVFTMNSAWAKFPSMLAQGAGMILAPAAYAGAEFKPIGAGPFTLDKYAPAEQMILKANKSYWKGEPYLDAVRFIWPLSDDAKLAALNDKSADVAYLRNPVTVDKAVSEKHPGELQLTNFGNVVQINNAAGRPGSDLRVRKAIALALDPAVNFQRAYEGKGLPGSDLFPAESRWSSKVKPLAINAGEAKKLVEEAKANGFDGKISYMDGTDPTSRAESVATKALLEGVGFTVDIEGVASIADQIKKIYVDRDYDLARGATSVSESDPYQRLQGNYASTSRANAIGYANPDMDAALAALQAAGTDEATQAALDKIVTIWNDTVPSVIVGANATFIPWQDNVHGLVSTSEQMMLLGEAWKRH
ncbi:Dipeptide-binding ABC transporter, periplasmic substrate-binding component (TC 3.A.1.5.2) [Alloactinosynnema sp. L-07]|uniref:ABC transporter substrate-binding protein n=1 Tax=Alloactinosynnema sp. L-07 TaxID=1653480 RepID=UPI00065F070B|nr:ABC transporter substrate-binding protein [Alloactinosynnema sp. L-07]CRK57793.1 Dipeptide-binding ABC transporter, periplasmic substrate-binding component (TC 3.A.1.5.2) [Alloactinosynnema sp. L-07]